MNSYNILNKQVFTSGNYSLVPIRMEDRFDIMKWRNEQMYHLRQSEFLTEEMQNNYFNNVVSKLFEQERPSQLLFSYLENSKCVGYGGLVHINWIDQNAEISFIIDTTLEKNEFKKHWSIYLELLEQLAFEELKLHKIYTYAFDLRPYLYEVIESQGFEKEAVLKEHCFFESNFRDVVIHSKMNNLKAFTNKEKLYNFGNYTYKNYVNLSNSEKQIILEWRNHLNNRKWMFNQDIILWEDHLNFIEKLKSSVEAYYWLVAKDEKPIGGINLIHVQTEKRMAEIGYFLDPEKQGGGLGLDFVFNALKFAFDILGFDIIQGNVMDKNRAAYLLDAFLGFEYKKEYFYKIDGIDVKFHYCELTKEDFYNNIEIKNDIDYFIKFYKQNKYGN
jgi:UDP-4-amino-4,6-dideoxy-N-acetyl-beta-L-altrosamine N-acetyltransferase